MPSPAKTNVPGILISSIIRIMPRKRTAAKKSGLAIILYISCLKSGYKLIISAFSDILYFSEIIFISSSWFTTASTIFSFNASDDV